MTHLVAVIGGGQNAEHDVSLATAAAVGDALRALGHTASEITIGRDGTWWHEQAPLGVDAASSLARALTIVEQADVVFPAVHGPLGEDGALAALCALAHRPVVGSGLRAGAIGMDKWATKLVAEAIGIPTAPGRLIQASTIGDIDFETEVVVKPVAAGPSYGVSLARDAAELSSALRVAARYDDRILVEQVVRGREIDIAVLRDADGTRWSPPPLEIHTSGLFDTTAKYDGSARFTVPADLDDDHRRALDDAALTMFDALGCSGLARIDFFLTEHGPVLNEVNTMPGMTPESQVPRMFAAAGLSYQDLIGRLVAAVQEPEPGQSRASSSASSSPKRSGTSMCGLWPTPASSTSR